MAAAEKIELLKLLEEKHRRRAHDDLNAYCRYIEIPGVPLTDDEDCEEFYPDTVIPAAHHELINRTLMEVEAGLKKRVMLFMPPGSAKSTYGTVTFPTWFMGRKAGRNVICTSYNSPLASKFGRKCRQITRSKRYMAIFDTELVSDNRAADDWSLTNASTYMAGGILSGITGNRADGLVIDDPIRSRADADSELIRNKIWEEYTASLRTRLKPSGFILIIQTRWHVDDLSGRILPDDWNGESGWVTAKDGEQWFVISLQAQCETDSDPLGRERGEWLWTDWFTPEHWKQEKNSQGDRNWAALYQQRPTLASGNLFKPDNITIIDAIPVAENGKPLEIRWVRGWDFASTEGDGDYTAGAKLGMVSDGRLIIADMVREQYGPDKRDALLVNTAMADSSVVKISIPQDPGQAGKSQVMHFVRKLAGFSVHTSPEAGNKENRADPFASQVNAGNVLMLRGSWNTKLKDELRLFPNGTYDDQADALSRAYSELIARPAPAEVEDLEI